MKCAQGTVLLKKRSNVLDSAECKEGDVRFRRWEYWGLSSYFILHYTGDHTIYESFGHRGAKDPKKPFIRSAPFVNEKVNVCENYTRYYNNYVYDLYCVSVI